MPDTKGIWKADIGNAFNTIERGSFLSKLNGGFKKIYKWVAFLYSDESNLYFHDRILLSRTGVQQGDPMGPFLFGLGINKAVKYINSFEVDLNKWYLDDGVMAGDTGVLEEVVKYLEPKLKEIGLEINWKKCEWISQRPTSFKMTQRRSNKLK